ncbi:MAG: lipoyl synthase [Bacteroidales bacterium]
MQRERRLPEWLRMQRASGEEYVRVKRLVQNNHLHTICTSGNCPNIGECWNAGTATFMILGDICTRSCRFCGTGTGRPLAPDTQEPLRLAESIKTLRLNHCVVTSVDRDDLSDGGAAFWAETIREIKKLNPGTTIETLIPDFDGKPENIQKVIDAGPDVISHNLETVRRLTPQIRSRAKYETSLSVIEYVAHKGVTAKSGIMVGLGESDEEVYKAMDDLLTAGCTVFTIGQYLQPSFSHMEVVNYITPEKFEEYRLNGLEKGFSFVESSPLVRSSYHAEKHVKKVTSIYKS